MEKQYSVKFFSLFIESLQNICQEHLTFDQVVEVSGYVSVEIDNARKERYVLSELLQRGGNVISESYCTKAYKNLNVALRETGFSAKQLYREDENKENDCKKSESSKQNNNKTNSPEPKRRKSNPTLPSKSPSFLTLRETDSKTSDINSGECVENPPETGTVKTIPPSGSIGIESRSSSFLASAAKPCSTSSQESFQAFVSGIIDSLESPTTCRQSISSTENSCGAEDELTYHEGLKPSKKSFKSSFSSSKSSTHQSPGQSHLSSTSSDHSSSTKAPFSLSSLFRLKPKPKHSESKVSTSKKSTKTPVESSSFEPPCQSQNMNISSLRHLVSKSYEDLTKLQQRKVGMESDIPPGEAYIEVLEEMKNDDEDGEIISLEDSGGEAVTEQIPSLDSTSTSGSAGEVPCTVSSSQMLEAGSISTITSMDDAESSELAISDEDDHVESDNADSPIIIDLDSDEDGEDNTSSPEGEDQPFSSVEIRKLDTFKDYVKFAVKRFQTFTREKGIHDPIFRIPPDKMDPLLAEFYVTVRNRHGEEFGISTLKSIQSYLELYLRENGYPISITRDNEFANCRAVLQTKIQQLREVHLKSLPIQSSSSTPLTRRDVDKLFRTQQLGDSTVESLSNSMWFMNSALFKLKQNIVHCSLNWGDIVLKVDEYQNEYLELAQSHIFSEESANCKVYPNNANPERCFVRLYKLFKGFRPATTLSKNAPFYLSVNRKLNVLTDEKMKSTMVSFILRNMLIQVGIQSDKEVLDYDIL